MAGDVGKKIKAAVGTVRKDTAISLKKENYRFFGEIMGMFDNPTEDNMAKMLKKKMLAETNKLEKAKAFANKLGFDMSKVI